MASRLVSSFGIAGAAVDAFASRVSGAAARIKADMETARASVFDSGLSIEQMVNGTVDTSNRKLGELELQLEALGGDNAWANNLLELIQQVKEGAIDGAQVINAFGDGLIMYEGRIQSVKDVLAAVLPSAGEVQRKLKDLMEDLRRDGVTMEELLGALGQQHNEYAQIFTRMLAGFKAGTVTLDALLKLAQQIKQALPGSATDALIEELMHGLRSGSFG